MERCFGVIQAKWLMITHPCRLWNISDIADVMYVCVIMHNMIIKDESDGDLPILDAPSSSQSRLRRGFTFNDLQVSTTDLQGT